LSIINRFCRSARFEFKKCEGAVKGGTIEVKKKVDEGAKNGNTWQSSEAHKSHFE